MGPNSHAFLSLSFSQTWMNLKIQLDRQETLTPLCSRNEWAPGWALLPTSTPPSSVDCYRDQPFLISSLSVMWKGDDKFVCPEDEFKERMSKK